MEPYNRPLDRINNNNNGQVPEERRGTEVKLPSMSRVFFFLIIILIALFVGGYYMGYTNSQDSYIESLEYYNDFCVCKNNTFFSDGQIDWSLFENS